MVGGCRTGAEIHVWQPPELESAVGHRVVISKLAGPDPVTNNIASELFAMAPRDAGRKVTLIDAESLQSKTKIQLVSSIDDQPNDLALAAVARREGIDFVLRGEVLEYRYESDPEQQDKRLKVSWRLTSLSENHRSGGKPVVVGAESAIQKYPDLAGLSDADELLTRAVVRDTFRLITPWIDRQSVQLAVPRFLLGSKEVRRGNTAAMEGRWADAEKIWEEVSRRRPAQIAAIHNLSLAAAAGQDFSRAKQLARKAIRRQPSRLHKNTLVWIEVQQREYHKAFGLPDPPEGWFVTNN